MPPPTWGGGVAASRAVLEALVGGSALPPGVVCSQTVLEALYSSAGNLAASLTVMEVLLLSTTRADFRVTSRSQYQPHAPRGDETEYWRATFGIELLPGTET